MKTKLFIVLAVVVLALLVSACGPATVGKESVRTLNVSGSGQANLAPDIAYIYVGVHTENAAAAQAVAENTTQTQTVIKAIKDFGIDEKDIRTTNFSIYPQDKYDPQTGTPTGQKTYVVDNTVYVTVHKLDQLGDLLDTVVKAQVYLSDREDVPGFNEVWLSHFKNPPATTIIATASPGFASALKTP
jgi:uncharacterized protein YggE